MDVVKHDTDRERRCGIPEVVLGERKSIENLLDVIKNFLDNSGRVIVTRIGQKTTKAVLDLLENDNEFKGRYKVEYNSGGAVLVIKDKNFVLQKTGYKVGILTAGTSDIRVAEEAKTILEELGCEAVPDYDVGVAGIHRLFPALDGMSDVSAIIVIAGMEGTLPGVVAGLVDVPVIGIPSSVGYGIGAGGRVAVFTMLASCTPVAVVNIDNGYGAAILAYQIARVKDR
jgi:hypothetical protein